MRTTQQDWLSGLAVGMEFAKRESLYDDHGSLAGRPLSRGEIQARFSLFFGRQYVKNNMDFPDHMSADGILCSDRFPSEPSVFASMIPPAVTYETSCRLAQALAKEATDHHGHLFMSSEEYRPFTMLEMAQQVIDGSASRVDLLDCVSVATSAKIDKVRLSSCFNPGDDKNGFILWKGNSEDCKDSHLAYWTAATIISCALACVTFDSFMPYTTAESFVQTEMLRTGATTDKAWDRVRRLVLDKLRRLRMNKGEIR